MKRVACIFARRAAFAAFLLLLIHQEVYGGVIVAGTDIAPSSTSVFTIQINHPYFPGGFNETISLNSGAFSIVRQQQQGLGDGTPASYIDTEILGLTFTGNSINVGPLTVRVGADNGVLEGPSLGKIQNVLTTTPGSPALVGPGDFVSGNSFFDVFFEVDAGGFTFYNRAPHTLSAFITALPPVGSTHVPPGTVDLYWRQGVTNSLTDQVVGFAGGTHTITPEPGSFALLGLGFIAYGAVYRKRMRRQTDSSSEIPASHSVC